LTGERAAIFGVVGTAGGSAESSAAIRESHPARGDRAEIMSLLAGCAQGGRRNATLNHVVENIRSIEKT
jgi:hypothetical protein